LSEFEEACLACLAAIEARGSAEYARKTLLMAACWHHVPAARLRERSRRAKAAKTLTIDTRRLSLVIA
jgi:hypothetical protein